MMSLIRGITQATLTMRQRLDDITIGSRVEQGKGQIVRVTYDSKGSSTVTPLSDWMPVSDIPNAMESFTL